MSQSLDLARQGTDLVYFTYAGKPLLSFGGMSDFMFYADRDALDYKLWANWASNHGMNHLRTYPPLSYKRVEYFTLENGGKVHENIFPYLETTPGSRVFDLERFNPKYWKRFRSQCAYLQKKGIIIHLLLWNGWQMSASKKTYPFVGSNIDWGGHFFNPDVNCNTYTDHLKGSKDAHYQIYHAVTDKRDSLVQAQKRYFSKLVEETADLGNVYYDLIHEIGEHYREEEKVKEWIDTMATHIRSEFERVNPSGRCIMGMDVGGLPIDGDKWWFVNDSLPQKDSFVDWIFDRPYFNLLIFGKSHQPRHIKNWRKHYKKPYIPQESWDNEGGKYTLLRPEQHNHIRKYMWKMMMLKVQQMDLYVKKINKTNPNMPKYPHNYDPRGINKFENDSKILRRFWQTIQDYSNLTESGHIINAPSPNNFILGSSKEVLAYYSSKTGEENIDFKISASSVNDVPLDPSKGYSIHYISPTSGEIVKADSLILQGKKIELDLPPFRDDLMVHIFLSEVKPKEL